MACSFFVWLSGSSAFRALISILFIVGAIALIRDTAASGHDFLVFWNAGQALLHQESIYSLARDGSMVFKYPPWIATFFLPLAALPLEWAKVIWGGIEVLSLVVVVQWVRRQFKCPSLIWAPVVLVYWGLWVVHCLDGQCVLPMLAIALWSWKEKGKEFNKAYGPGVGAICALTTKIFTVFPLLSQLFVKNFYRTAFIAAFVCGILSIPACLSEKGNNPLVLLQAWKEAATSSSTLLTAGQVRGKFNQGLPALILRSAGVPAEDTRADLGVALLCVLFVGGVWLKLSRDLSPRAAWVGWLGLTSVVHPLPWWHLFVFAFPLSVVALFQASQTRDRRLIWGAWFGILMITACTEKTLGSWGAELELFSVKSWGVILCAAILWRSNRSELNRTLIA